MKFGTYSKLYLHFQIIETTWCLIGFHGNNSQINGVTGGRHLGFLNFQILFKFSLLYLKLTGKEHLAVEIHWILNEFAVIINQPPNNLEALRVGGGVKLTPPLDFSGFKFLLLDRLSKALVQLFLLPALIWGLDPE